MSDNYGVSERQPFVDDQKRITRPWLGVLQRALRKSQSVTSGDGAEAAALLAVLGQTARPRTRPSSVADTHANRANYPAAAFPGVRYFETDRSYTYLSIAGQWTFAGGTMVGLVAGRPADLGSNDTGAVFNSTDSLDYRWDGAAWITLDTVKGGSSLANVGKLTMVTAAGKIGQSAVTDDGTAVTVAARTLGVNQTTPLSPSTGRGFILVQGITGAGVLETNTAAADGAGTLVGFWQGSDTHTPSRLAFIRMLTMGATANNRGGAIEFATKPDAGVLTIWERIDNAGNHGFGGNLSPAYPVDATGDINASGVFRKGGVAGATGTVTLAKIAVANGSLTFAGGIITAFVAPT